jgi:hypothetical protein
VRKLAEHHERLVLKAYRDPEHADDPALFAVAARWAELACRLSTSSTKPTHAHVERSS